MRPALVLMCLLLGSCTSVKPFTAPDGRSAYLAKCSGNLNDMTACYAKARETCGGDYEILNRSESQRQIEDVSRHEREIEFTCKATARRP
jgi:hypothetical protein